MSGKLDQSLDEILTSRRQTARRGRGGRGGRGGRRVPNTAKTTVAAPAGGIKKNTKAVKGAVRAAVPSGPAAGNGESKIIVSNLVGTSGSSYRCSNNSYIIPASRCERGPD